MTDKVKCNSCEAMILPQTARKNNGLCMPCERERIKKEDVFKSTSEESTFSGKYDDASWHYGGNFPRGLPKANGATHIGMYLAWSIKNNLYSDFHNKESFQKIQNVLKEKITGRKFLMGVCDEKFCEEDLNSIGNDFAKYYYDTKIFLDDYSNTFGDNYESLYEIEDTWENYHIIAPIIDRHYKAWISKKSPWWKFW